MPEFRDIYDKERRLTGRTVERGKPMAQDEYHIVVVAIIRNAEGKYLISKRAAKKHFPNMWEFMGGSVLAGKTASAVH